MSRPALRTALAFAVLSLIWGYSWVVTKVALDFCGPFHFAALRTVLGVAFLFAVLGVTRADLRPRQTPAVALLGVLQTSGFLLFSTWALVEGGAGKTAVLVFTMPFWTMLLAWPLLGERIRSARWIPVLLAFAGLVMILEPWRLHSPLKSKLLAIAAGISWAASAVVAKKIQARAPMAVLPLTAWQMLWGAVPLVAAALLVPERPIDWSPAFWAVLAYNSVLTSALGWLLWLQLLRVLPAGSASLSALAIPVIALLASSLQLGEVPRGAELWGMVAIGLALALLTAQAVRRGDRAVRAEKA